MPRGAGIKVKPAKPAKPAQLDAVQISSTTTTTKPPQVSSGWRAPKFLSRNSSDTKLSSASVERLPVVDIRAMQDAEKQLPNVSVISLQDDELSDGPKSGTASARMTRTGSVDTQSGNGASMPDATSDETTLHALDDMLEGTEFDHVAASLRDNASVYSNDSASIFSTDSGSVFSNRTSMYSLESTATQDSERYARKISDGSIEEEPAAYSQSRPSTRVQTQPRVRPVTTRRSSQQTAANRDINILAKKAAMFKNSELPPQLPTFSTSLPTWSMVCRSMQASYDCYDQQARTRRGCYTPADTSNNIKAMIVDEQLIDDSRLIIVAIRGTKPQSFSDWAINGDAQPVKPEGFLDDVENACHAGFLQVTKAMITQVATQLRDHPASSERPSLVITGHSAGGAVAALLYSHMLSTTVSSELTSLAPLFSSINCITFGAPPLSLTPLPRRDHGHGVFLAIGNQGDPVLRISNAAYARSVAKLMTATSGVTEAKSAKVVRASRGSAVIRTTAAAVVVPWEQRPVWAVPANVLVPGGDLILLRDGEDRMATASRLTPDDLEGTIFADLAEHTPEMYIRRVKEVGLALMMGGV